MLTGGKHASCEMPRVDSDRDMYKASGVSSCDRL